MWRKIAGTTLPVIAGTALCSGAVSPASAATGEVTVFETELGPLTICHDPAGCHKLPAAAHVLADHASAPKRIYVDPLCAGPTLTVRPGYGSHLAPVAAASPSDDRWHRTGTRLPRSRSPHPRSGRRRDGLRGPATRDCPWPLAARARQLFDTTGLVPGGEVQRL